MTDRPPSRRMHADEVDIDEALVRDLLRSQFPEWAGLPLRRMPSTGTDNAIYHLGHDMGIRLPLIRWAVGQIDKEYDWLDLLSLHLTVELPLPVAKGEAGSGYPYPWLVYRWLEGEDLQSAPVEDYHQLAMDLGDFVAALGRIDPVNGPPAGRRGGPLAAHDEMVRAVVPDLEGIIDTSCALAVWRAALDADRWPGPPVWVHGDLLPGNVLIRNGRLRGVIDWSAAGLGDPACEAMLAWSLPPEARRTYRQALGFDDATWARARGWVVEQTALFIPYYAETIPDAVAAATIRLQAALDDPVGDGQ
jgi:aminoglycoside phosphotransferase (APT) family kinase protein